MAGYDGYVYNSRPYHAPYLSDDEGGDDDICVWDYRPESDSEDEPLANHFRKVKVESKVKERNGQLQKGKGIERPKKPESKAPSSSTPKNKTKEGDNQTPATGVPLPIGSSAGRLTEEAFREREVQYALSTARRNLTHVSQFLLKLEARAGKATKEGIRQTLDATVADMNYDFNACGTDGGPPDADHKSEIEEIKNLSRELYKRMHLLDRYWRRIARQTRDSEGRSPNISILSEGDIREWINVEIKTNHLMGEETCFYTVRDLVVNRPFRDWVSYLQQLCKFSDHPSDQAKLVELAWRFLDRNLRGPRPLNPTSIEQFIADLDARRRGGKFDELHKTPKKQEEDDAEAWKTMKRYWSSRTPPG
ncbi:hypothetical protein ONZ43_g4363 [Nemania bipapillata]|uniref:Uncharacterized protein n=1 Tax=Nemania bipapillata TaxID=110536 RepID=A0ACC2INK1_9PEZI|nr:hypothetical protein ONZ43_g4363 [Nemania bipapillata]